MPNSQQKTRSSAEADVAPAMRTFACFISEARRETRTQSFVLAQSDERACELARRELLRTPDGVSAEVVEGGRLVAVLHSHDVAADQDATTMILRFPPGLKRRRNGFAPLHAAILQAFSGRGRSGRDRRRV